MSRIKLNRTLDQAMNRKLRNSDPAEKTSEISLAEFQQVIRRMYHEKDAERGIDGTFMWLAEEFGELAAALRGGNKKEQQEEFADVLAWLATIANIADIDLTEAIRTKYGSGCPGCGRLVCDCSDSEKP